MLREVGEACFARVSLHGLDCPGAHYVDQADLELTELFLPLLPSYEAILDGFDCHICGLCSHPGLRVTDGETEVLKKAALLAEMWDTKSL